MPDPDNRPMRTAVKYNPHLWDDDELRAIFVARERELDWICERMRAAEPGKVPQHLLVTGYRGMGKTTLLRRVALAVADDPKLAPQWIALTFPEEQYTVATLAELWINVLDALADTLEKEGAPTAELRALDARIHAIQTGDINDRAEAALELLTEWVAQRNRRILLLIDSSDKLFAGLGVEAKRGRRGAAADPAPLWRLRKTLSHCPDILWLGTSYKALESEHHYSDAFHDFFEILELRPLTLDDMRNAMLALARTFGIGRDLRGEAATEEMRRNLDARPERLKSLRTLTGGNPRTTVILYGLFAAGWQGDVHSDLKALLDDMTPLYMARMENLAEQPRKLFAHLMEHWAPVAVRDLAEASDIPSTTVSSQLTRLEAEGLVQKTRLAGTRRTGYQASERFFNVWYLMRYTPRRVRQRLTWLVEFMRMWFSADDLQQLARNRLTSLRDANHYRQEELEHTLALVDALPDSCDERHQLEWRVFSAAERQAEQTHRPLRELLPDLFDSLDQQQTFVTAEDYLRRFRALSAKLALCPCAKAGKVDEWIDAVTGNLSLSLAAKERIAETALTLSEQQYSSLLQIFTDETKQWQEAVGDDLQRLYAASRCGAFFPDCPDPKLAYQQILTEFGDAPGALLFAIGLMAARHADTWVEKLYRKAIELDPKSAAPWNNLGNLLKDHLQRYDEAEAAYRTAIELDPKDARPWNGLGYLLQAHLERYDEAEAAYRTAIELDPKSAGLWNNLGNLLQDRLQRYDEAEAAYRKAIELDPKSASPWNNLGNLLQDHLQRCDEAEAAFRRAAELNPQNPYPEGNLARLQAARGKKREADALYRRVAELAAAPGENLNLLLQAQLWLRNLDAAGQALGRLAGDASAGDGYALFLLQEQARECHAIALGISLAELMEDSDHADLLRPISLALRAADGGKSAFDGVAAELRDMAEESLADIQR